jgi:uncharacterized protein
MPEPFRVEVAPRRTVAAIEYPAAKLDRSGITLILGHGAGAGQTSGFIVSFARALAERGVAAVTFNFPYMEDGRRIPDPSAKLEACYRAVIEGVRDRHKSKKEKLAIGGKSMGGRIASQVAAGGADDLAGLVFLGYPLHPPAKPEQLRATHLPNVKALMLFVQGSRDAFGAPDELHPIIDRLQPFAELYVVEGGDHSFRVLKSAGLCQAEIYHAIQDKIETWLRAL